ncbi:hypothetical protein MBANPS3_010094 [Mucor bainieri]
MDKLCLLRKRKDAISFTKGSSILSSSSTQLNSTQRNMPSSVSSKSTRSSRSSRSGRSNPCDDCGCSEEAAAAWIIIPLITGVAIILALTLSHQEPFSQSARDQREANYYDGYSNREDVAVIDTAAHELNITMKSAAAAIHDNGTAAAAAATWNGTAVVDAAAPNYDDTIAERSVVIRKIVALNNID